MSNSESDGAAARAKEPRRFFEKQLAGEQPLSFETAGQLFRLGMQLLAVQPWEFLEDQDLYLMQDGESGEICYCSTMGALGEVFSLQVYTGAESYRFFRRIAAGKPTSAGDFYSSMRGVSVGFATAREQTPPDRELLEAFGHLKKRGKRAPIFRALRPGYHPWYVTEGEAKILVYCLQGILAFCRHAAEMGDIDYWEKEDIFPFLVPKAEDKTREQFEIRLVKAPEPPVAAPRAEELDESLISGVLPENLPKGGALEADHFFTGAKIGEQNERKACLRIAMVSDGDSGFAFLPELGKPEDSTGQLLARALLGAMRDGRFVPREVRVRHKEFKILLSALSERIGFGVRVTKSLPALDHLKDHFLAMVGDPGEISDW
jgi:hypothetical protein